MTEDEAAEISKMLPNETLQRWRKDGAIIGRNGKIDPAPPYYKCGGSIRYERGQLNNWMLAKRGPSFSSMSMEM